MYRSLTPPLVHITQPSCRVQIPVSLPTGTGQAVAFRKPHGIHDLKAWCPQDSKGRGPSLTASVVQQDLEKRRVAMASVHRHARFGATLVKRTSQGINMGRSKITAAPAAPRNVARNAKHHVRRCIQSQIYALLPVLRRAAAEAELFILPMSTSRQTLIVTELNFISGSPLHHHSSSRLLQHK